MNLILKEYLGEKRKLIDNWFESVLPNSSVYPKEIHEAMNYMVFSGGKRVRPVLVLACCEACGGNLEDAKYNALAVELIHTYSLIHDDLPCMDNDDYRRGKETCHKKFGEANAVLAGDALLTFAFEVISMNKDCDIAKESLIALSRAVGSMGMIGGQVVDKIMENRELTKEVLDYITIHKTGKLITVSCLLGAISARAGEKMRDDFVKYGEYLGYAFQVVDDILDNDGYLRFMSRHEAYQRASELVEEARKAVSLYGDGGVILSEIAGYVLKRGEIK